MIWREDRKKVYGRLEGSEKGGSADAEENLGSLESQRDQTQHLRMEGLEATHLP